LGLTGGTEDLLEIETLGALESAAAAEILREAGLLEGIVLLTLLGVREDIVRLRDLFELLFGGLVPRIHVGVVLFGELAVCLLDLVRRRAFRDPEDLVVVFLAQRSTLAATFT
jgi:hypothetical protein